MKETKKEQTTVMRAKDVIAYLKIHRATLARWKQKGIIRAVRVGGIDYYCAKEVQALLKK